jgi:hypothetical protein
MTSIYEQKQVYAINKINDNSIKAHKAWYQISDADVPKLFP